MSNLKFSESAPPSTPSSGKVSVYVNSTDHKLHILDSTGLDISIDGVDASKLRGKDIQFVVPDDGDVLIYSTGTNRYEPQSMLGSLAGDGSDGNIVVATGLTLAKDSSYDTIILLSGAVISTNSYRLFANTIVAPITGTAWIENDGSNGGNGGNGALTTGGSAGAAAAIVAGGSLPPGMSALVGKAGAAGRTSAGNGTAGTAGSAGVATGSIASMVGADGANNSINRAGSIGIYTGGNGGAGAAAGAATMLTAAVGSVRNVVSGIKAKTLGEALFNMTTPAGSAGSGGSGAAGSTGTSGAGGGSGGNGSGGGFLVLTVKRIFNGQNLVVSANGGRGGNGGAGGAAGATGTNGGGQGGAGGTGGGGGYCVFVYSIADTVPSVTASGGLGGTGGSGGLGRAPGADGAAGITGNAGSAGIALVFKV
jgi:hypothetical protein